MATEFNNHAERANAVVTNIQKVIVGKDDEIRLLVSCLLARGHALIEDRPGMGKTTLAEALARSISGDPLDFKRIQCTPDILPSDITGFMKYRPDGEPQFIRGPIFAKIVLADELNRATPRTQSALLEAMNEGRVTVDGVTHPLPEPFMLMATQNPQDFAGTFPLPAAQLDRFTIVFTMDYASEQEERRILADRLTGSNPLDGLKVVTDTSEIARLSTLIDQQVRVAPEIIDYVIRLARGTRADSDLVAMGVSPRGALHLVKLAKAHAFLQGREFVIPDDIKQLAHFVFIHRLMPSEDLGQDSKATLANFIAQILEATQAPSPDRR